MTTFTESHARLSDKSYDPHDDRIDTSVFLLVREVNQPSGYRGAIYKNIVTNEYVVANTGTEFDVDKLRDLALTDAQMVLLKANQQLDDARDTVELAIEMAKREGTTVTVTGHSLGGFLTQVVCHEYRLHGETYNAFGAAGLYGVPTGGSLVVNHVRVSDMVGAANRHFGEVRVYATQQDVDVLLRDGALPSQQSPLGLIQDLRRLGPDATHGAVQFHGGSRTPEQLPVYGPNSIITHENHALYQQHKAEFDTYRESIRQTSEHLTALFKSTGVGVIYSAAIGSQYIGQKAQHHVLGSDVHAEIRELRQTARQAVAETNRHFVPPAEPLIYRGSTGDPGDDIHRKVERLLGPPSLRDDACKPGPGSGWPTHPHDDAIGLAAATQKSSARAHADGLIEQYFTALAAGDREGMRAASIGFVDSEVGQQALADSRQRVAERQQQLPGRDHPLFAQAVQHLQRLGPEAAKYSDHADMERIAGTLAYEAQRHRMPAIDEIVPTLDGRLMAAWTHPHSRVLTNHATVDPFIASAQPLEQNFQQLQTETQRQVQEQLQQEQQRQMSRQHGMSR
jgi:hypothetical protein